MSDGSSNVDENQLSEDLINMAVVVKKQQAAAQAALEQLAAASAALDKQVAALKESIPAVRKAAEDAAYGASSRAFAGAAEAAARSINAATMPVLAKLESTLGAAGEVEARLRRFVQWWSWSLARRLGLVFGAGVLVAWALAWAKVAWHEHDVQELLAQRQALSAHVEQLEQQAARLKLVDCEAKGGPKGRRCLPVDLRKLYGERNADVLYFPIF